MSTATTNVKYVELQRHYGFIHASNPDKEAQEYFDMSYKAIGSYFKVFGKVYASGLTKLEENLLMPELVGYYPEDREFKKEVNLYFKNINTKVSPAGEKLNIALKNPNQPLSKTNLPVNILHYVTYKHAIGHPHVCESKEAAERRGGLAHFYILDKQEETKSKSKINRLEDDAAAFYFKHRDDDFKVTQMLTLLGISVKDLDSEERIIKLKELSSINEEETDVKNTQKLQKFIDIAKDTDLGIKYDIMEMIRFDILERVKNKILDKESGTLIGDNLKEAVLYFKDKRNSKDRNVYYARLNELGTSTMNYEVPVADEKVKEVIREAVEMSDSELSAFEVEEESTEGAANSSDDQSSEDSNTEQDINEQQS